MTPIAHEFNNEVLMMNPLMYSSPWLKNMNEHRFSRTQTSCAVPLQTIDYRNEQSEIGHKLRYGCCNISRICAD